MTVVDRAAEDARAPFPRRPIAGQADEHQGIARTQRDVVIGFVASDVRKLVGVAGTSDAVSSYRRWISAVGTLHPDRMQETRIGLIESFISLPAALCDVENANNAVVIKTCMQRIGSERRVPHHFFNNGFEGACVLR